MSQRVLPTMMTALPWGYLQVERVASLKWLAGRCDKLLLVEFDIPAALARPMQVLPCCTCMLPSLCSSFRSTVCVCLMLTLLVESRAKRCRQRLHGGGCPHWTRPSFC